MPIDGISATVSPSALAVDVVLRTHNRADLLLGAVESLLAADRTGIALRLIIVDNASRDSTPVVVADLVKAYPHLIVPVREDKPGGQHALNAGIAAATAPIIAFFDDDEHVSPQWLQVIAREFADPATDFIGGPCLPAWDAPPPDWLPTGFGGVLGIIDNGSVRGRFGPGFVGMMTQGNCALRAAIFAACGPYPADLATAEDRWLWGWLMANGKTGYYCPDLEIRHIMQTARLSPDYFRRWAKREGRDLATCDRLAGVRAPITKPWFWRMIATGLWATARGRIKGQRDSSLALTGELTARVMLGHAWHSVFRL